MDARAKAQQWLDSNIDDDTRSAIESLLQQPDNAELTEAFYKDLEFGTGGLRGVMGVGSNRMNKYTVGMATQGLCNYLGQQSSPESLSVAIAYDSRNNSAYFAECAAAVFSANSIRVYLFDALRPTPELSFAVRHLGCAAGVVITASHNPKEYNGYKAYWHDGSQLIAPHDQNVIAETKKIASIDDVSFEKNEALIQSIGKEVDDAFIEAVLKYSLHEPSSRNRLKIVYSPIHGSGFQLIPTVLSKAGFTEVTTVAEQAEPDGNFPTVVYPNPEEQEALSLALNNAREIGADLVMATDPDADRVGIAVRNLKGNFELLNGNQTATVLMHYIIERLQSLDKLPANGYLAKTIVTTDLIDDICRQKGIKCYNTLTGFKYIAELIRDLEGEQQYIAGCEESYGYLLGDFVRDKDAVTACLLIAEMAAVAMDDGQSLYEKLLDIYCKYGFYLEDLLSITKTGKDGAEEIAATMHDIRNNPPEYIGGSRLAWIFDYEKQIAKEEITGDSTSIKLPKSNVIQLIAEDGSKVSMRPSGTEPKIKFYFSVRSRLDSPAEFEFARRKLQAKIETLKTDIELLAMT